MLLVSPAALRPEAAPSLGLAASKLSSPWQSDVRLRPNIRPIRPRDAIVRASTYRVEASAVNSLTVPLRLFRLSLYTPQQTRPSPRPLRVVVNKRTVLRLRPRLVA